MSAAGALRFGRYAFPPNRLGYCGPEDHDALFQYVAQGAPDRGLVELERRFDGAFPYLKLIAAANGIGDPFDARVVEAYWVGNSCLDRVVRTSFYESLHERFRPRMNARAFEWLTSTLMMGARPHHNFHVFEVYRRAGLMKDTHAPILLSTIDRCRISWGRVLTTEGGQVIVEREPIRLIDGKLAIGKPEATSALHQIDGKGFVGGVKPGEFVSMHWDWACEVLSPSALRALRANTRRALAIANLTV